MKQILLSLFLFLAGTQINAADYYWVSGSGNWSDFASHWATTSGGNVFHTQAPGENDNVFFDGNSFPAAGAVVTINVDASFTNMDWTGVTNNPQLAGATGRRLNIFGSLTLNGNMTYNFLGNVHFLSLSTGRTITMAGASFRRNVYFQGAGGWVLQDNFSQTGSFRVYLERGTLDFNGQNVTVNQFDSYFTTVRTALLRNSTFTITSGGSSAFSFRGENFTFNAGSSTVVFTGSGSGISHVSNQGNGLAFHDVIFENTASGASVSIQNGSFHSLTFNGNATVSNGNTIQTLTFNADGTINHNDNNVANMVSHETITINGNGSYGTITMNGNGIITGNNTIGTLILTPGNLYTLTSGRIQLITDQLLAEGSCAEQITIQSGTQGSQSTISKSGGGVTINYCILRDINASGGATFIANNSVNLGNNTGLAINQPAPLNLYWVGGNGSWNDPANWSLTSGGAGWACVPSPVDNVFFNANSFSSPGQSVTLTGDNTGAVNCRNMNWAGVTNNPSITGTNQVRLNIFGSLTLNPSMSYDFSGEVHFRGSTTGNTIFTAGRLLDKNNMYFNGQGEWRLLDGLDIGTRTLFLVLGSFNTNDQPLSAGIFNSWYSANTRALSLGSSEITLRSTSNSTLYIHGSNMTLNSGTSRIRMTSAGTGINNSQGGGLFFHDLICEATTGTVDVYNLNGGFNTIILKSTGTSRLWSSNTVDSIYFAGVGGVYDNNNNIRSLEFNSNATIGGTNGNFGTLNILGTASISGNHTLDKVNIAGEATIGGNGNYDLLSLGNDASITGNNTIGTLIFEAGKRYTLTNNRIQTILDDLIATGTETELIVIRSNSTGSQSTFTKESGTVTVNYVSLSDNNAIGGANFIANNSYDLGNNSGWVINMPPGRDYYWVGGTGSWDNIQHWAITSGGEGGAGIPSLQDNVFFDANSFTAAGQAVTIVGDAANNAYCLNMDWTGTSHQPSLEGASAQNLRIHGSLKLIENITWNFLGLVHFESSEVGNTITTAGVPLDKNHLYLNGEGGEWTLQDGFDLGTRTLYLVRGSLLTNNHPISAGILNSWYSGNTRALILGSSEITLKSTSNSSLYIHGLNMTLDAGTSLIRMTGAGTGINNSQGGGLFFNNIICEATTGTVDIYNLNGGFNTIIFNSTGTNRLWSSNTVDSIYFAGVGAVYDNNNNIRKLEFSSSATIGGTNGNYGTLNIAGNASVSGNHTFNQVIIGGEATVGGNGTYNFLSIGGDASITGNNTFGTLIFSAGKRYTVTSARTQTILHDFIANGTETELIVIRSSSTGSQTTFTRESGTVELNYISLRDNIATGGAEFIANNSFDLGNNTGWTINMPPGKNYYWVGGTGSWDNIGNWSLTSGGAGGAGIPSLQDNVFFDANSFTAPGQAVTLIGDAANDIHCLNMNWIGAAHQPAIEGASSQNLRIHGSLTLSGNLNWNFQGPVYFHSKADGNTITTAGVLLDKNHLYLDGQGGEWILQDAMDIGTRTLFLVRGSLNTNDQPLSAGIFNSWYSANNRALSLGASEITLRSTSNSAVYFHGTNMNLDAGTSVIRLISAGAGLNNSQGGGLFFHNLVCEATTGTVDIYNLNGGFNNIIFNSTGTSRLWSANTVDSIFFAGVGGVYNNNNNIRKLIFNSTATISDNSTYDHILMKGNGSITGNNTIGTLEFTPGNTYTLTSGRTQTIRDALIAEGTCYAAIHIQSSSSTSQTTLSKTTGTVTIQQASLQGINVTGGAEFLAENSSDMGNNTGWTFTQIPQNLFWVGGSGDWSNVQNWAAESGGPGGYCVPTRADNVIFDQHSFTQTGQAVFIDMDIARCYNMDWTGALNSPTFTAHSNNYTLRIHGSLALNSEMNFAFAGSVYFEGEIGEEQSFQISMAGKSFNNNIYFNSPTGVWTLLDAFSTGSNDLYLNSGTLNTNDQTLSCRRFFSNNNNVRALNLGASVLNISSNNSTSAWNVSGNNFNIIPGTSEIRLTTANGGFLSTGSIVLSYNRVVFQNPGGSSQLNSNHSFNSVIFNPVGKLLGGGTFNEVEFMAAGEIESNNTFGKVTFFNNGLIRGSNFFESLKFTAGRTIQMESSQTQTLAGQIDFWGNSANPIYLRSITEGVQAIIQKDTGSITGNYIHLRDMNASGDAEFIVYNAEDLGNNTGWSFLEPPFATCPDNFTVCINVGPFPLTMALPAGGQYSGTGVSFDGENNRYIFDPSQAGAGETVITYESSLSPSTCEFRVEVLPVPEVICRDNIEVAALGPYITLYEGFGTYSMNGQTITGFNPEVEGTYTITYTLSNECGEASCEFLIMVSPPIIIEIQGDREICEGDTAVLSVLEEGTYLWSTGATTQEIKVTEPGDYSVIVILEGNYQAQAELSVIVHPLPAARIIGNLAFCSGEPIQLTAQPAGTYLWNTGATDQNISVTQAGEYSVTVTDINGCYQSAAILLRTNPGVTSPIEALAPANNTYGIKDPITFSWTASENAWGYDLYIWLNTEQKPASPVVSGITGTSHRYTEYLNKNFLYNWQVVATNFCTQQETEVRLFSFQAFTDLLVDTVITPETAISGRKMDVSFTISNTGSVGTGVIPWKDDIYISASPVFSTSTATKLASVNNVSTLGSGESYTNTVQVTLPISLEGEYYVFVRTDATNSIPETNENNNVSASQNPVLVNLPPLPDLAVSDVISLSTPVVPGEPVTIEWKVDNIGDSAAIGGWSQRVAIISGTVRQILGYVQHSDTLEAGGTLTQSASFTLSKHPGIEGEIFPEVRLTANPGLIEKPGATTNNTALSKESILLERRLSIVLNQQTLMENATTPLQGMVYRSGIRNQPLTVNLVVSEQNRVIHPQTLTIPAGQSGIPLLISAIDNDLMEGDIHMEIYAQAADYPATDAAFTIIDDELPSLILGLSASEAVEGETFQLSVNREWVTDSPLEVMLTASKNNQMQLPASVLIGANQASVTIDVKVVNDSIPELDEMVTINASAVGYIPTSAEILIIDNDLPELTLIIDPSTISEGGGAYATWGTVKLDQPAPTNLQVLLSANVTGQVFFPSKVTIPKGALQQKFNIGAINNNLVDGDRLVELTASVFITSCGCGAPAGTLGSSTQSITIIDNNGPSLSVLSKPFVVPENIPNVGVLTISRNTPGAQAITVNIQHNGQAVMEVPPTAVIPDGAMSVDVPFSTLDDGVDAGDQTVTVSVTSEGYSQGSCWVQVKDQNLPDFVVRNISLSQSSILINDPVQINLFVVNEGYAMAAEGAEVRIFRSEDTRIDSRDLLLTTLYTNRIIHTGDSLEMGFTYVPDDNVGGFFIIANVNAGGALRELTGINNTSEAVPLAILPDYTAIASVDGDVFNGTAPIAITGFTRTLNQNPAPNKPVDVYISVNGTRRIIQATSDQNGAFSTSFIPTNGEAGSYHAGACYPGQNINEPQDEFIILGAKHTLKGYIKWDLMLNQSKQFSLDIQNLSSLNLSNVKLEVLSSPSGVQITSTPLGQLSGNASATLQYSVNATEVTIGRNYQEVKLRLTTAEGTIFRFSAWVYSQALKGNLRPDPVRLSGTMVRDAINYVEFDIFNNGMDETGIITVEIPKNNWMSFAGESEIPSLQPGEWAAVTLLLTPGEDMQLNNPVSGSIAVKATNAPNITVPFTYEPVSSYTGNLLVDVVNEYTYNTAEAPHLEGASVVVSHPYTGKVIAQGLTNVNGHFVVEDLNEGHYNLRVQAPRHGTYQNLIYVEKGITNKEVVFIEFQAITYSWDVVPTFIQDEYEITLIAVFETNVPAPVIEMIMPDTIPFLNHGATFPFILTLANHGLITAQNVEIAFPEDDDYTFTANVNSFDILPQTAIQVPVVVSRNSAKKSSGNKQCTGITIASYQFECGPDDQIRIARKSVYYEGRICGSVKSGGTSNPVSWPIIYNGTGPGLAPGGGGTYRPPTVFPPAPYKQTKQGCDPCLVEFLNALWGCSPIPQIGFSAGRKSTESIGGKISKAARYAKKLKSIFGKVTCAFDIGWSIGCKINEAFGWKKNTANTAPAELIAASEYMSMAGKGFEALENQARALFGNEDLLAKQDIVLFVELIEDHLDEERPFSESDVNELLVALADSDITPDEINGFVNRWNITVEAWGLGFYSPTLEYPNIIDTLLIHQYELEYEETLAYANSQGFAEIEEMYNAAFLIVEGYTEQSSNQICATVTVQFSQTLTMTREAFEGTLTIFNGHESDAMENIRLELEIRDEGGLDKTQLFQINTHDLIRITGIDGTGSLNAQTEGSAVVMFIPEREAAPEVPRFYSFGGTLSYLDPFTGNHYEQKLFPVTLQVNPSPDLYIDYFLQRDILGNDPFTDVIEPSIQAEMAVMIHNKGFGTAYNVNIESAQPRIIDNEKGLLIDFKIVGSNLGGKPAQLGLMNVDFGNLGGGDIAVGQWWFTSSLLGHFISYEISVNHLNSFGNPNLSLVSSIKVNELIKSVTVYGPLNDSINDFLVNEIPDSEDIPDALYYSNGTVAPVFLAEHAETNGQVHMNNLVINLTVTPYVTGWNYARLDDPGNGRFRIVSCIRDDGQEIPLDNIWLTHVTIPDGGMPVYENRMHVLDMFEDGSIQNYTLTFEPVETDIPEVVSIEGIPAGIASAPVTNIQVVFNKAIDPETFTYQDMILRNQGGPDLMDEKVIITRLTDSTFNVDISSKTSLNGYYTLIVQAAGIADTDGNFGQTGKQVTWIQALNVPAITHFFGLPDPPGDPIDQLQILFNMPIAGNTFTTNQLVLKRSDGSTLPTDELTITAENPEATFFSIKGLEKLTSGNDQYELQFKVTEIQGESGNFGIFDQPAEWAVVTGKHIITATAGPNGTIDPSGYVLADPGGSQSFTITPEPGYRLAEVWVDGVSIGSPDTYTFFNVSTNHSIHAEFEIIIGLPPVYSIMDDIKVYPNPVNNELHIDAELGLPESSSIRFHLLDFSGRQITNGNLVDDMTIINVDNLSPGIYTLVLYNDAEMVKLFRIIKY